MTLKKGTFIRRGGAAALAAALLLATPAMALFGSKEESQTQTAEGAPIARELELRTYRNIPYHAQFLAVDQEGDELTYTVEKEPRRGTVTVEGDTFTYTPAENRTGTDSFTYVATDSQGNVSAPATVTITVSKTKSGVRYADMENNAAAAAAQALAENGVFTGSKIGDQYFFEPDRTVTRSEFLAMTMETAGLDATSVTMTGFCDDEAIPTWSKAYAAAGVADGIVQGKTTDQGVAFQGEEAITFSEAATILDRVLDLGDVDLETWYADREAVPSWAAQAVGNMEAVSVLSAGSFGSDGLEEPITRADAAMMLSAARTLLDGEKTSGILDWLK